ncbi:MAG: NAD-dependent epimerase/dehydratase family protein [Calditrichaeota bacterium]|nr:NAD-dependent epimerase/dehydratase family protein [Calditrichota bacterium]
MKMALVTGGAGFLGSNLTQFLLENGYNVVVYDNFFNGKREFLPENDPNLEIVEGDLRETQRLKETIQEFQPQTIFHLAALHFIPYCNAHPIETIQVNVEGTESVLEAAQDGPVEKVIYASTAAVYGIFDDFNLEEHRPWPMDIYGDTKYFGEHLMRLFHEKTGKTGVVARLFNLFGPNETNPHVIPEILDQLRKGDTVHLGNLKPKRDYIYVLDVAKALFQMDQKFSNGLHTFNVGTGHEYSVDELVKTVADILGRDVTIEIDPARVRKQERLHLVAGIDKIKKELGWQPEEDLFNGLKKLIEIDYSDLLGH